MVCGAGGRDYEFVLRGEIGDRFAPAFEGMRLKRIPGKTTLTGRILDQACLHGVIARIQDLGIELISVNPLDEAQVAPIGHDAGGEQVGSTA